MGKPKKGGFPAVEPKVNYVAIKNGEIENATIAWGDSVVWMNHDAVGYTIAGSTNGQPDSNKVWATLTAAGTDDANSSPMVFTWTPGTPKDPQVYPYGMLTGGKAKATLTVQISV
ncbi:MAG TPA: hypothetical protein VHW24_21820 [Bryobacteraceae bacterium]|jgi:hypothetical protein|nr:hypothetical protein [Bryobacteraceae bacterium]